MKKSRVKKRKIQNKSNFFLCAAFLIEFGYVLYLLLTDKFETPSIFWIALWLVPVVGGSVIYILSRWSVAKRDDLPEKFKEQYKDGDDRSTYLSYFLVVLNLTFYPFLHSTPIIFLWYFILILAFIPWHNDEKI